MAGRRLEMSTKQPYTRAWRRGLNGPKSDPSIITYSSVSCIITLKKNEKRNSQRRSSFIAHVALSVSLLYGVVLLRARNHFPLIKRAICVMRAVYGNFSCLFVTVSNEHFCWRDDYVTLRGDLEIVQNQLLKSQIDSQLSNEIINSIFIKCSKLTYFSA